MPVELVPMRNHLTHTLFPCWDDFGVTVKMVWIDEPKRDVCGSEIPVADQVIKVSGIANKETGAIPTSIYAVVAFEAMPRQIGNRPANYTWV